MANARPRQYHQDLRYRLKTHSISIILQKLRINFPVINGALYPHYLRPTTMQRISTIPKQRKGTLERLYNLDIYMTN